MNNHRILFLFVIGILSATALGQSYSIHWHTIDGGGGTSTGGAYSISGSIGQPDAGTMSGGGYSLAGGFWSISAVQMPEAPLLSIRHTPTNTVMVSWPSSSVGFSPQSSFSLNSESWIAAPETIIDNGTNKFILLQPATGNRFYRLFKP